MKGKSTITVDAIVNVPPEKAWECWTEAAHITHWNFASEDWWCPAAENDPQPGGLFSWRMEARDGSIGFDFSGEFLEVDPHKRIESRLDDGRILEVVFEDLGSATRVTETFEAEDTNSVEMQRAGWQAILDNFKKHTESV